MSHNQSVGWSRNEIGKPFVNFLDKPKDESHQDDKMSAAQSVLVAGVGPGLGLALAMRFAREGYRVAMLARSRDRLASIAAKDPDRLVAMGCDVTDPAQVDAAFDNTERQLGPLACAIFNAGAYRPGSILDIAPSDFEHCWRVGAFAGFLVGQAAARRMADRGSGTILFTGATASLRGSANFVNLASPKFALRAIAQSIARELGPRGIHVAHVIIDGQVGGTDDGNRPPDSRLAPDAIAEVYLNLHRQHRSAWSQEVDVRPWVERY
jgi:NAD(P)-dependent dehydrogenase (short-subunit alcohol dehydrogenase family)